MPKIFKWYKDDFGFSKQEILAYYASFMQQDVRQVCGLEQCGYTHAHTRLYICSYMDFHTYIILVGLAAGADRDSSLCVLILLYGDAGAGRDFSVSSYYYMCPHATI